MLTVFSYKANLFKVLLYKYQQASTFIIIQFSLKQFHRMKMHPTLIFLILLPLCHVSYAITGGTWKLLQKSIGISAMHMQLTNTDKVVTYDRTDFGPSNISLAPGKCQTSTSKKNDCTAHSVEYNVLSNSVRPLTVQSDVWCSSGSLMSDGRLVQTGGNGNGDRAVRTFRPCATCDWEEVNKGLVLRRWYATNHKLPDGTQIIVGGRGQFNYEFYPKSIGTDQTYKLQFLADTNDKNIENNLYPFVFLNTDGNLFIFANNRAILFNYKNGNVVKTYPYIPDGGNPRNYPSTGSAVLLPIKSGSLDAEVLVCGGAPKGSFASASNNNFVSALNTCARLKITDASPSWVLETMPLARCMGDMVLLPNGNVIIINGAAKGSAGWESGRDPVLRPVIYKPDNAVGSRFEVQNPSTIPRMYHSTAVLLRDGRVLVGGSNPHAYYNFTGVLYPTELSVEAFSPDYVDSTRPTITLPATQTMLKYGQTIPVRFKTTGRVNLPLVTVTLVSPSFNTHSFSMNQRLLVLGSFDAKAIGTATYQIQATMPGTSTLAPPGYYMLFVVHQGIPSEGIWINIQ